MNYGLSKGCPLEILVSLQCLRTLLQLMMLPWLPGRQLKRVEHMWKKKRKQKLRQLVLIAGPVAIMARTL